jgi:histone H3/H4
MDKFICLQTTMSRILKQYSGVTRIERVAAVTASKAADDWLHSVVANMMNLAIEKGEKTFSAETATFVTQNDDVEVRNWPFCKTRVRDRIKRQAGEFRISLAAKIIIYNAFDDYLKLLASRIAVTQELANRKTISAEHVKAAIDFR